jgi:hypothetical protein
MSELISETKSLAASVAASSSNPLIAQLVVALDRFEGDSPVENPHVRCVFNVVAQCLRSFRRIHTGQSPYLEDHISSKIAVVVELLGCATDPSFTFSVSSIFRHGSAKVLWNEEFDGHV